MVTASILSLPNKGIRFVKYLTATRVRILLVLVWVCVQSIIKRLRQFSLGFYKIHKCYHWKINIIYIYMLYILRMNIKENSSNNHKSTFRIKNFFFTKEKNKSIANFSKVIFILRKISRNFYDTENDFSTEVWPIRLGRVTMKTIIIVNMMVFTWSGKSFRTWNCKICSYSWIVGRMRAPAGPLFVDVPSYQLAPRFCRYQALKF